MQCIYLCFFSISLFIESENSSVIKSWSPYVTLLNYFATFPLIWFLNSSQQTLLNLELLLSNRDRHSKKANVWRGNERGRQISPGIWTALKHDLDSLKGWKYREKIARTLSRTFSLVSLTKGKCFHTAVIFIALKKLYN